MSYHIVVIKKINHEIKNINKGCDIKMEYNKILQQIENGDLTSQEAFNTLYPEKPVKIGKPGKRASFIKMNIKIPDEGKGLNTFLKILFAFPIPMIFARLGLRFAGRFVKEEDVDLSEISKLLKYSKNTMVQVDTDDAQVDIRII